MVVKQGLVGVLLATACMFGAAYSAMALKPSIVLADEHPPIHLEQLIPTEFGQWRAEPSLIPVVPDPSVQKVIDATYSQTVARGYVNANGDVVMLTIAYGKDQNSESTAAHRPEFCYTGQGFAIQDLGVHVAQLGDHQLALRQMVGTRQNRVEHISYWVTLDNKATLPGLGRKLAQLNYGLRGQIADGMLIRISNLSRDARASQQLHDAFIRDLERQIPVEMRPRFFGS